MFDTAASTWGSAVETCEDDGAHIAAIETQAQNDWVAQNAPIHTAIYIGATDQWSQGTWKDIFGEILGFTNWHHTEPNKPSNDCVVIAAGSCSHCGFWFDAACNVAAPFVCAENTRKRGRTSVHFYTIFLLFLHQKIFF